LNRKQREEWRICSDSIAGACPFKSIYGRNQHMLSPGPLSTRLNLGIPASVTGQQSIRSMAIESSLFDSTGEGSDPFLSVSYANPGITM
jgi:hypothetical protein